MRERDPELDSAVEKALLDYIRLIAEASTHAGYGHPGWAYRSTYHLLLEHGRFHAPAPRLLEVAKLPDRLCYENAAATAHADRAHGLIYAEGFATPNTISAPPLEHAWCVRPDGTVVDPTWQPAGAVYFGVALADSTIWPTGGGGLLSDFDRSLPLLRDGLPAEAWAGIGRRPADHTHRHDASASVRRR